jgi:putative OPT family oligopeptide transporter
MTGLMIVAGFLFSAVAGYMAGLVGSSNNPISGVTIATILTTALILVLLMGKDSSNGAAAAILVGAVVCCAAAIAGDNMQDLKAGYLLGATPIKQQGMQMIGVIASALVLAPVLTLLHEAYTIGSEKLVAPQAALMRDVANGIFGGELPWDFIGIGAGIAVIIIAFDLYLKKRGSSFRMPVLAVSVGMYLPLYLDTAILFGGIIAWLTAKYFKANKTEGTEIHERSTKRANHAGILFASGLITGEALIGILLAIPIAIAGDDRVLAITDQPISNWFGFAVLLAVCVFLYRTVTKAFHQPDS